MNRIVLLVVLVLGAVSSRAVTAEQTFAGSDAKSAWRLMEAVRSRPDNLGWHHGGFFRGAQLVRPEQYYYLRHVLGVKLVINMTQTPDDAQACRENGLGCAQFPIPLVWPFSVNMDWNMLRRAFYLALDAQRRGERVYFHCEYGSDRTGALAAALTVRRNACGKKFNKDALWAVVDENLKRHRFHEFFFPQIHRDIKSLVYNFKANEPWLCR